MVIDPKLRIVSFQTSFGARRRHERQDVLLGTSSIMPRKQAENGRNEAVLIVGLGNPGKDYDRTRHNAGFMVVDAFAKVKGLSWKHEPTLRSTIAEGNIDGQKMLLMKPTTYMNASGEAVRLVMDRFHILASSVVVVSDDVALALGTLRVRSEGGAGGHNGLKSIIQHIGSQTFWRIKVGVNPPPENISLETYVLNRFMKEEHGVIDRSVAKAVEILSAIPGSLSTTTYTV